MAKLSIDTNDDSAMIHLFVTAIILSGMAPKDLLEPEDLVKNSMIYARHLIETIVKEHAEEESSG